MSGNEVTFDENEFIVSKTDLSGRITYGNAQFIKISGYNEEELLGAPHNILRHPAMPAVVFALLWETIQQGSEIFAYVVNQAKSGDYYWVFAHVTPSFDARGTIIGYHSVRRKPSRKAIDAVMPLYEKLSAAERTGGIAASRAMLTSLLASQNRSYDEFVLSL